MLWLAAAAVVLFIAFKAGEYVGSHLVVFVTVLAFGCVLAALAFRLGAVLVNRFAARFIVLSWHPADPPVTRKARRLPEPIPQDAQSRPFTESSPALSAGAGICEGPSCGLPLPQDPRMRWRCGTGAPVGEDSSQVVRIGETHEFCSEKCANDWIAADEASQARA